MLLPKFSLIYIHIPKTSGNSLQSWLLPLSEDEKKIWRHQDGTDRFEITGPVTKSKHMTLDAYARSLPNGLDGWRVMTSIRHPFERAMSLYFSPNRWFSQSPDGAWTSRSPTWDEAAFFRMLETPESRPMTSYLTVAGQIHRPDVTLRHSNMATDLKTAAAAFDLPTPPALPHLNRSVETDGLRQKLLADPHLRDLVEARFQEDLTVFGFDSYSPKAHAPKPSLLARARNALTSRLFKTDLS